MVLNFLARFGRALARLRTKHRASTQKLAAAFLRKAREKRAASKALSAGLQFWMKHANLEPVFSSLSA